MSKILVVGTGPLLEKGVRSFSAHCLRTWHLVQPLLAAGHEIRLFTLPIYSDEPETQLHRGVEDRVYDGLAYQAFRNCDDGFNQARLLEAAREFRPDALLGINSYPSRMLADCPYPAPMWADLNGSVVIEGQVKAAVYGNNSMLGFYWAMEEAPLRRCDKFSAVAMRQLYALHGELAAVGRLNRHTLNYTFAGHIPNAHNPAMADIALRPLAELAPVREVRGKLIPENAFVVLWSGGYNAWADLDFLLAGLEGAMEACPDLYFVSTGGPIHGHDDLTYPRWQKMTRRSRFHDRIKLLGWIDAEQVPSVWKQADLGLCVDARNFETMFGARNRTINMLAAGLPVLTTTGAEISEELTRAGCALPCGSDSPDQLAQALIRAAGDRDGLRAVAERGRAYTLQHFTYASTTRELLAWMAAPEFAPDNLVKLRKAGIIANAPGSEAPRPTAEAAAAVVANPFYSPANPIEDRVARMDAPPPAVPHEPGPVERVKRGVEGLIGPERYSKLRFVRQTWARDYLPRYQERRREINEGRLGKLEDLYVFLTNQCNARCKHCFYIEELGYVPGEMVLEEYEKLAPTIPGPLRQLTLTGGEAMLHPQAREIIATLARGSQAQRTMIISNGFLPGKLEALCASILEDGDIPGVLDVLISMDGLEPTHNAVRVNPRAWLWANHTLEILSRLKRENPGRFDVGVITIITDKNYNELEPLNNLLRSRYPDVRHGFELIRGTDFSLWGMPEEAMTHYNPAGCALPPESEWDDILAALKRINRRAGIANHAFHLTTEFAFRMLKTKKKIMDCVSAGQNVGVIYPTGELALCEFSQAFANVRDFGHDFQKTWTSAQAQAMREKITGCHCTHGCYLSKNIEYSWQGQLAMLTKL